MLQGNLQPCFIKQDDFSMDWLCLINQLESIAYFLCSVEHIQKCELRPVIDQGPVRKTGILMEEF